MVRHFIGHIYQLNVKIRLSSCPFAGGKKGSSCCGVRVDVIGK